MRFFARIMAAVVALCASVSVAHAQAVLQSGPVTPFHVGAWYSNGVQGDAGTPQAPFLTALGLLDGAQCPFGISSQTTLGVNTSPAGTLTICQTATATTFMITGVNGQATPSLVFNIGGVPYTFTGSCIATAPTVTSAGTSPSIPDNNGTCAFTVNVGTGGTATTVVLGLPTAPNGWSCTASDITTQSTSVFLQKQTASTVNSATIINYNTAGAATAFTASDKLRMSCHAD